MPPLSLSHGCFSVALLCAVLGLTPSIEAQVVPGTGNLLNFDDLEDANWGYVHNFPKSSKEEDENIRYPLGASNNRMWSESPKRGSPDVVKRVETPPGGLPGSTGSLYLRTRDCGIPGHPGNKQAQDDFILSARPCGVGYSPNFIVRVYLPEFEAWEQRQGVSFGIRAGLQGMVPKEKPTSSLRRLLRGSKKESEMEVEPYYPGFFVAYNPVAANPAYKENHAQILIRSDHMGHEVAGPKITQTGWWTFGMSVTPDSRCHYYARAGVGDLTAKDHLYSSLPYNIRGDHFNTIFFNVCSADNASSWSTPWIIDDPKVYYSGQPVFKPAQPQQAQQTPPTKTAQAPTEATPVQNATLTKEIPAPAIPAPVQPVAPLRADPAFRLLLPTPGVLAPAPAAAPMPIAPLAPLPSRPAAAVSSPVVPVSPYVPATAPALLSTSPQSLLKPAQPLQIPVSGPLIQPPSPAISGPLLIIPAPPVVVPQPYAKPDLSPSGPALPAVKRVATQPPNANPFDDAQTPNVKPAKQTPVTESVAAPGKGTVTPLLDEPPLVLPEADDASIEVDPAPVPGPPAE